MLAITRCGACLIGRGIFPTIMLQAEGRGAPDRGERGSRQRGADQTLLAEFRLSKDKVWQTSCMTHRFVSADSPQVLRVHAEDG